jgi:hypothetical protein
VFGKVCWPEREIGDIESIKDWIIFIYRGLSVLKGSELEVNSACSHSLDAQRRQLVGSDLLQDGEDSISMKFGEMGCEVIAP